MCKGKNYIKLNHPIDSIPLGKKLIGTIINFGKLTFTFSATPEPERITESIKPDSVTTKCTLKGIKRKIVQPVPVAEGMTQSIINFCWLRVHESWIREEL